jgi:lambda repressor-like predicted transcriptional regulator
MGRKSKLTEDQKADIQRRMAAGESCRALAREFGMAESSLRAYFSARVVKIQSIAKRLATVEDEAATLPVSAQITVRDLATNMRTTAANLAAITALNTRTAHRLAKLADKSMGKLEDPDADPDGKAAEILNLATYGSLSHNLSRVAVSLVTAGHPPKAEDETGPNLDGAMADLRRRLGMA